MNDGGCYEFNGRTLHGSGREVASPRDTHISAEELKLQNLRAHAEKKSEISQGRITSRATFADPGNESTVAARLAIDRDTIVSK